MKKEDKCWEDSNPKQKMLEVIACLPDDASFDEGMDSIVLLAKIDRAMAQVAAGQTVPHEEVRARLARWAK